MNALAPSLERRRADARERFRASGLPHRRLETWKYTDLGAVLSADEVLHADFAGWGFGPLPDGAELVELYPRRELPRSSFLIDEKDADWVQELLGSVGRSSLMSDASLGFARSGFAVRIPKGASSNSKMEIKRSGQVRALIVLEEDAALTLVHRSGGLSGFQNLGIEIVLGKNSRLTCVHMTPKSTKSVQLCEIWARLAEGASYRAHFANFGSKLSRTELHVALQGEGAEAHLSGVSVLGDGHADVTTHVTHAVPNTQSTQLFKYIAGGHSRAIYQGKVSVRPGANGADSRQTAKGLLHGTRAEIDLKPELEILADDVKCAHGAAVGDLDAESLFYLRSRGLPEAEARALLMRAFVGDAIDQIESEDIRADVWAAVESAFARMGGMNAPARIAAFDPAVARKDFAILSREVYGRTLVYLDSAASAQKPDAVLDAMRDFATRDYANVHRGVHYLSGKATDAYEAARRTVQTFLNAAHEDEIVFTKGGTEAINLVSYSYLAPRIQPGDEIVLSVMEHHSNIVPWHFLRERQGAVLRWVDVRDDGSLDAEAVDAAIGPKTKLVAISHMSNVLGTVTPLKEIVARAHAKGVPVLADGAQGAVHEIVDVRDLDIDFYAITGHKLYGPTGIGALYAKRAYLKAMRPFNGGGEMIREVTRNIVSYADPPARFEAGTPAIIESVGLAAAIDYMNSFDRAAVAAHEHDLLTYARNAVREFNWLRVIGDAPGKGAILSFETEGMHAHDVATILDREGVAVRAGHHCAQPLMERFGVASTSRASFALYNMRADVDALIAALAKARKILGSA